MLSFPRDLWVPIADTGQNDRINSAYGRGRQVLVDTIRKDFGVDVNNYIEVDFRGFKDLVSAHRRRADVLRHRRCATATPASTSSSRAA